MSSVDIRCALGSGNSNVAVSAAAVPKGIDCGAREFAFPATTCWIPSGWTVVGGVRSLAPVRDVAPVSALAPQVKVADGTDLGPPAGWHDSHRPHFLDERRAGEHGSVAPFSVEQDRTCLGAGMRSDVSRAAQSRLRGPCVGGDPDRDYFRGSVGVVTIGFACAALNASPLPESSRPPGRWAPPAPTTGRRSACRARAGKRRIVRRRRDRP